MKANFPGEKHFTASVWLVSKVHPKKVLLIHHKKHNSWLQPGGHIEPHENPVEAAIRETKEETGIDISSLKEAVTDDAAGTQYLPVPHYFLQETIPSHNGEPQHFHLDVMYIIPVDEQKLHHNQNESHDIGWFTKDEALQLPLFTNTKKIILDLLDKETITPLEKKER